MTGLARLVHRTRLEAAWQAAVRLQRLQERITDPAGTECPCGAHVHERLTKERAA